MKSNSSGSASPFSILLSRTRAIRTSKRNRKRFVISASNLGFQRHVLPAKTLRWQSQLASQHFDISSTSSRCSLACIRSSSSPVVTFTYVDHGPGQSRRVCASPGSLPAALPGTFRIPVPVHFDRTVPISRRQRKCSIHSSKFRSNPTIAGDLIRYFRASESVGCKAVRRCSRIRDRFFATMPQDDSKATASSTLSRLEAGRITDRDAAAVLRRPTRTKRWSFKRSFCKAVVDDDGAA